MSCPLCLDINSKFYFEDKFRSYLQCTNCRLVYVPAEFFLSAEQEKNEYEKHQNDPFDAGYRAFLGRLFNPLIERLDPAAKVLDFGCGPGPALAEMFREKGFDVAVYDPFFAPNAHVLVPNYYDAITATEVIEHLHKPAETFANLLSYLSSHGQLGIMTKTIIDVERFARWHYKNDPTHVCFYSNDTFDYLAEAYSMRWHAVAGDAFIFSRLTVGV